MLVQSIEVRCRTFIFSADGGSPFIGEEGVVELPVVVGNGSEYVFSNLFFRNTLSDHRGGRIISLFDLVDSQEFLFVRIFEMRLHEAGRLNFFTGFCIK